MRRIFRGRYDEAWSSALYDCYESGDNSVLNELLESLGPLIRWTYIEEVDSEHPEQCYIEANALVRVHDILLDKDIPNGYPRVFTKFLRTVIKRSILNSFRELRSQEFDFWGAGSTSPAVSPFIKHDDVELLVYREQLRKCIRKQVSSRIRFLREEKAACLMILEAILGFKKFDPSVAKRRYRINTQRCKYLIRYVNILIKAVMYEQREQERRSGTFTPIWASSRSLLCAVD